MSDGRPTLDYAGKSQATVWQSEIDGSLNALFDRPRSLLFRQGVTLAANALVTASGVAVILMPYFLIGRFDFQPWLAVGPTVWFIFTVGSAVRLRRLRRAVALTRVRVNATVFEVFDPTRFRPTRRWRLDEVSGVYLSPVSSLFGQRRQYEWVVSGRWGVRFRTRIVLTSDTSVEEVVRPVVDALHRVRPYD